MGLRSKKLFAAAIFLLGAGVFGLTLVRAMLFAPTEPEGPPPPELPASAATAADAPARLLIPTLGVDANVQHVGVGKSGNMAVPNNYTDAGWYRYGTAPGFLGSAVIDGHVNNGLALPGVFKRLSELKVGDTISVVAASGARRNFAVSAVEIYDYKQVPVQKLFLQNDKARLNLVTCDGTWIAGEKTYNRRLVVYAELTP